MRLEIIETGVISDGEKLEIGTVLTIEADAIPPSLVGKVRKIDGDTDGKTFMANPAKTDGATGPTGPFTIGEAASGWYPVLDASGATVKKLRKADADAFATLSPDDQIAYLSE